MNSDKLKNSNQNVHNQNVLQQWILNIFKKQAYRFSWEQASTTDTQENETWVKDWVVEKCKTFELHNAVGFIFLNNRLIQASELVKHFISEPIQSILSDSTKSFIKQSSSEISSGITSEITPIRIPKGTILNQPLYIFHVNSHTEHSLLLQPKIEIEIEAEVKLSLIEGFFALGSTASIQKTMTQITLKKNSEVNHLLWGEGDTNTQAILHSQTHLLQNEGSQYRASLISSGFSLQKNKIDVELLGSNATTMVNAISLPKENEYQCLDLTLHHLTSGCQSQSLVRGVAKDHARFDFIGKIVVAKEAKRTQARLENKNLLLSKEAHIETSPELEVYNDDVQCSHGATVGSLDDSALFYLQSRGISEEEAKQLLIQAFLAPTLTHSTTIGATEAKTLANVTKNIIQKLINCTFLFTCSTTESPSKSKITLDNITSNQVTNEQ